MEIGPIAANYLSSNVDKPFFVFVSDGLYMTVKNELSDLSLAIVRISDFCGKDDKWPDMDDLVERLKSSDKKPEGEKLAVLGLGEYLTARGRVEARNVLSRLKDLSLGNTRAVLLLHGPGLSEQITALKTDIRFNSLRHVIIGNAQCSLSITHADPSVALPALKGFKALLRNFEDGDWENNIVNSALGFEAASFGYKKIASNHDGITRACPSFTVPASCGNDEQWAELLRELEQNDHSLDAVFDKHGLKGNLEAKFYSRIATGDYRCWLYFIALKYGIAALTNSYLRFVVKETSVYEDLKKNILNAIIDIPHTDKRFTGFYADRKVLLEKIPEPDIADFVFNNRVKETESVYKLTDGTKAEREEVIAWVSKNGFIPEIVSIYPALIEYKKRYVFKCPGNDDLAELLTDYFEKYKEQKISNVLDDEFLKQVDDLAHPPRKFNHLPTRDELLEGFDKSESFLLWLDALGVEYLAFIVKRTQERGLSVSIKIARAELPTITSPFNNGFFKAWPDDKKRKIGELDDVKHKEAGGYNFLDNKLPIHLAQELEIIKNAIDDAATILAARKHKRVLIVSDHGASRLAVLACKEERYETDTNGEHSGRCCKYFEPYDLPFASEENGYLALADYGRFKGGRKANVEVHGGASLEEVVVPIIELTLKDAKTTVRLTEEEVLLDFRVGTEIELYFNFPVKDVSVLFKNKRYPASMIDDNRYKAVLTDLKRAGDYLADVYAGENLIGQVTVRAIGKSGRVNNDFDNQF